MEEKKPFKAEAESPSTPDVRSGVRSDIRNLWTKATLSQPKLNMPPTNMYEDSDQEDSSTGRWYQQPDSEGSWGGQAERSDEDVIGLEGPDDQAVELQQSPRSSQRNVVEGAEDSGSSMGFINSVSSLSILKHTHHRAYWVEQQTRLPLPLIELMENEVLEILTKALQSYRSVIGRDHFLTKQLQRYIEGLRKRRNKRQHVSAH